MKYFLEKRHMLLEVMPSFCRYYIKKSLKKMKGSKQEIIDNRNSGLYENT